MALPRAAMYGRAMNALFLALLACSPDSPDVAIAPRPAASSDDLVVAPDPPVGETWVYRWARDGEVQSDLIGNRVPADRTRRGQRWKVTVERRIGNRSSAANSASTVVQNGPPTVEAAVVEGREGLQAVTWVTDPDGDPVEVSWSWELDGDVVQLGGILPTAELSRGQTWTLRAWGNDDELQGPDALATYLVGNQPPVLWSAAIAPNPPTVADALTVDIDATDPDGDPLTVEVEWRADGAPLYTGTPLPAGTAPRGPWIDAVVVVTDGIATSDVVVAPGVRLTNAVPSIASVAVEPPALAFGTGPNCAVTGWSDADGDPEHIDVRWFIDSVLWMGIGSPSGTELVKGQQVLCEATPFDGEDYGDALVSAAAPVLNSPPSVARIFLEPEEPTMGDTVTVRIETSYDPDGDPVVLDLAWYLDGNKVGESVIGDGVAPGGEVFPAAVVRGGLIEVEGVPFDGETTGVPVYDDATVTNALPQITSLTLSPSPPQAGVDLVPVVTTNDTDGDLVDVSFEWQVDGGPVIEAPFLPGAQVISGTSITVRATPDDGFDAGEAALLANTLVP